MYPIFFNSSSGGGSISVSMGLIIILIIFLILQYLIFFINLDLGEIKTKKKFLNFVIPFWGILYGVLILLKKLTDKFKELKWKY